MPDWLILWLAVTVGVAIGFWLKRNLQENAGLMDDLKCEQVWLEGYAEGLEKGREESLPNE